MSFVHENAEEFADLVQIVSGERGLRRSSVKKDYWVTHTLWALTTMGLDVWFKGGTSLSKGFGLIERFSEDLDLKIEPGTVTAVPGCSVELELDTITSHRTSRRGFTRSWCRPTYLPRSTTTAPMACAASTRS